MTTRSFSDLEVGNVVGEVEPDALKTSELLGPFRIRCSPGCSDLSRLRRTLQVTSTGKPLDAACSSANVAARALRASSVVIAGDRPSVVASRKWSN